MALRRGWMEDEGDGWASDDASADDAALAMQARTDRAAFATLYDRHVDRIYGYCYRRLQTHAGAEDATSQTFLKALSAIGSYRADGASFRSWLFTIASRVVIDTYRAHRPTAPLDDAVEVDGGPDAGPEGLALAAETRREVTALVARLPDEQAHLVHLRLAGLTDREIAGVLGTSHGAARVAQHRALKRLRELASTGALAHPDPIRGRTSDATIALDPTAARRPMESDR